MTYEDGSKYDGEWNNGQRFGNGILKEWANLNVK